MHQKYKKVDKYKLMKHLGQGSFSNVYYAVDDKENEVAIKVLPRKHNDKEEE